MFDAFNGEWAYRSFLNNPDLATPVDQLLFGAGTMELEVDADGNLTGALGGSGWSLALTGTATAGPPMGVLLEGRGVIGGEDWAYDYRGYLVPDWPAGVDQVPALVGSVIRAAPHSGGQAAAGLVASWFAPKA